MQATMAMEEDLNNKIAKEDWIGKDNELILKMQKTQKEDRKDYRKGLYLIKLRKISRKNYRRVKLWMRNIVIEIQ